MALESVPWFIGNGAEHTAASARAVAYVATQGATGVIGPGDFQVIANSPLGGSVMVLPGAGSILSTYPGAGKQSYIIRADSGTVVPIAPAPAGAGRTDFVVAYVSDPEFAGAAPASVEDGPYVFFAALTQAQLDALGHPYLKLAKVTLAANQSVVTQSMIDSGPSVREVGNPRRLSVKRITTLTVTKTASATGTQVDMTEIGSVEIPPWATQALISSHTFGASTSTAAASGHVWLRFVALAGPPAGWDFEAAASPSRMAVGAGATFNIPAALRGTTSTPIVSFKRLAGAGSLTFAAGTTFETDIMFIESAAEDAV